MPNAQVMLPDRAVLATGEKDGIAVLFRGDALYAPAVAAKDALEGASVRVTSTAGVFGPLACVGNLVFVPPTGGF